MMPGTFTHPALLAPALALAAVALLLGAWAQTRPGLGVRVVGQHPLAQGLGLALVLAGAGLGLAEPRWGTPEAPRLTVRILLDASRSMGVRDADGPAGATRTRWEAALADLDRLWSQPNPGILFSLDLLTGDALPLLPPGDDLKLLRDAPRAVTPGEIGSPGTSLGRGIPQAAAQAAPRAPEILLLLTDGEETWETEAAAIARASAPLRKAQVPLFARCYGKEEALPVGRAPGQDELLFSKAHPAFLAALAEACGGRALKPGEDLHDLFQSLAEGKTPLPMTRSRIPAHPEAGAWMALAGICIWLAAAGRPMRTWRPFLAVLVLLGAPAPARAGLPQSIQAWLAQSALERGDLQAADRWKPRGDRPAHRLLRAEIELRGKAPAAALTSLAPLIGQGAPRPLPPWRIPALLMAARAAMDLDRPDEARAFLERALIEQPGREEAIHNLQTLLRDPGPPPPPPRKPPPPPPSQASRQDELDGLKQRLPPKKPGGVKDL
ncbi:vWA domain-containing protein [Mesoterricola sediminis]|uniref:VWFA domain-containing protein n=1 Tax=Mesoterricola sediminis TaxID=2927980 RepID=A0AA48GU96_9BACT|nr:hypothetical protein [Mesoterricola sediminis]BDU76334.1 hypothetical protein METESE_12920 [Mesoterricola sediminis]